MNMNKFFALVAALALALTLMVGCGTQAPASVASSEAVSSEAAAADEVIGGADAATEIVVTDEGEAASEDAAASEEQVSFTFSMVDPDGNTTEFHLEVENGASLGDALYNAGLISEDEYKAGFVTVVNEVEANWDENEAWWNLQDAEGNSTPVGIADILPKNGDVYSFVYTIGF